MTTSTANPMSGVSYLKRGFAMLSEPGIRVFVWLPLLFNVLIFGTLIGLTINQLSEWMTGLLNWLPDWLDFVQWLLWPLAGLMLLVIVGYSFSIVANIIAAPFNGLLAEKVEEKLLGKEVQARENLYGVLLSIPRSLWREVQKLGYTLIFALLVFILTLMVPPAAPFLWFGLGGWMMAMQYCDFAMDNNRLSFKDSRKRLAKRRTGAWSLGLLVMAGTMVPILNLFIMPAAVCAGTIFWVEQLRPQLTEL